VLFTYFIYKWFCCKYMPVKCLKLLYNFITMIFVLRISCTSTFKQTNVLQSHHFHDTHPEPLPPTMATFWPAGTVKLRLFKIFWPETYSKFTSSNVTEALVESIARGLAFGFICNIVYVCSVSSVIICTYYNWHFCMKNNTICYANLCTAHWIKNKKIAITIKDIVFNFLKIFCTVNKIIWNQKRLCNLRVLTQYCETLFFCSKIHMNRKY